MDIKSVLAECRIEINRQPWAKVVFYTLGDDELEIFAQKIIAARDAEWMAEPVAYTDGDDNRLKWYSEEGTSTPLFCKPKEVK